MDARPANTDPSISIHAPREGSDLTYTLLGAPRTKNFYPRSP